MDSYKFNSLFVPISIQHILSCDVVTSDVAQSSSYAFMFSNFKDFITQYCQLIMHYL